MKKLPFLLMIVIIGILIDPSSALSGISKNSARISSIQIPFIENQGQIDDHILYYTSTQSGTLLLTRSGVQILLLPMPDSKSVLAIHEQFVDAKNTGPVGLAAGKTRISHYKGSDPKTWRLLHLQPDQRVRDKGVRKERGCR
jgi:hypothetical protein